MSISVANVKLEQYSCLYDHDRSDYDTLYVDESVAEQIKSTGELRVSGVAYDVLSWKKIGNKICAVVLKDSDETHLERIATKDNDKQRTTQCVLVVLPLYHEDITLNMPIDLWFSVSVGEYRWWTCYSNVYPVLHSPPPKVVA